MEMIKLSTATDIVADMKDMLGKGVDKGTAEALAHFVVLSKVLGCETDESCEGHADWGHPYPSVTFSVPYAHIQLPPLWNIVKWKERRRDISQNKHAYHQCEESTDVILRTFSRMLVDMYHERPVSNHETMFVFRRTNFNTFKILPVFYEVNEMVKLSGRVDALHNLLKAQRDALMVVAGQLMKKLEGNSDIFEGVPENACMHCFGKIH